MKCYFALSDDVSNRDEYFYMFRCTLESAVKNTSLELHCIYDFKGKNCASVDDDRIYKLLKEYEVNIHLCSIDFEEKLLGVYTEDYLKKISVTKSSLYSRFLRFMLADIEHDDEYIIYADTDVIFLKDISLDSFKTLPKTVGVCPEFVNTYNYDYFNAGIMLINLGSYKNAKKSFISMLEAKQNAKIECCDQGYLNLIYENDFLRLDNKFNWKPYWGINDDAVIVHLHGLKPKLDLKTLECRHEDWIAHLFFDNKNAKEGFFHYFNMFANYAGIDNNTVITNLLVTLQVQNESEIKKQRKILFRIARKIKKIFGRR